jgi:predicted acetyltransferase
VSELTVRLTTDADFDEFMQVSSTAFLHEWVEREKFTRQTFETHRFHAAFDADEMIGTCGILGRRMTLPGAGPIPVAAVTAVTVKPGHRRRGALTRMMRAQLHGLHDEGGEAIATLWASEASIYGRFGYGSAANHLGVEIPAELPFRPGVELGADRVRQLPRDAAIPLITELYRSISTGRPGWLDRDELSWNLVLLDVEEHREGSSPLRFAVHPEGYAVFRTRRGWNDRGPDGRIHLRELVAGTPVAAAALWRHLLDYDLIGAVHAEIPLDDPIIRMLADPRQAVAKFQDSLWVRLVDVNRALVQRRYAAPVDVVLELTDEFCPWNAGRLRLTAPADAPAGVTRTDDPADLALEVTDLGAAFLGGPTLVQLADAGRVRELTPGALVRASRAFAGDRPPHCLEVF